MPPAAMRKLIALALVLGVVLGALAVAGIFYLADPVDYPLDGTTAPVSASPSSGAWSNKSALPFAVADIPAATCGVGGVNYTYLAGGFVAPNRTAKNLQRYDPVADAWTEKALLPEPTWGASAASYGGHIYYFSGDYSNATPSERTQVYDCARDAWTIVANRTPFGGIGSMALAAGNLIYVQFGKRLWTYDPATDAWTTKAVSSNSKRWSTFALVNSRIYVLGGFDGSRPGKCCAVSSVDVYDITNDSWTVNYDFAPHPDWGMSRESVVIDGWIVYAFGLSEALCCFTSSAYLYNPSMKTWATMPSGFHPRDGIAGAVIGNTFYAFGGRSSTTAPRGLNYTEQLAVTFRISNVTASATASETDVGSGVALSGAATGATSAFATLGTSDVAGPRPEHRSLTHMRLQVRTPRP